MAGLLEDPETLAQLSLAAGLLSGGNFGQAAQRGLLGYQGTLAADQERQLAKTRGQGAALELRRAQRADADETALKGLQSQFFSAGTPGQPGTAAVNDALPAYMRIGAQPATPGTPARADISGYTNAAVSRGLMSPIQAIQLQQSLQKESSINKLDPKDYTPESLAKFSQTRSYADLVPRDKAENWDGLVVNPYKVQAGQYIPNANKPFGMSADGQIVPNTAFQQYELGKARAGASNTSVRVENKMGEGLAAQIGPMMRDSAASAEGAAKQVDAANRIVSAVDSNKLFSGPGANARMSVAQVAEVLGVGGKDTAEKIANTRQAMQGLAQLTLQGRAQMRGQGAITDSESALAQRATSGDVTLTAGEIKQLANSAKRAANYMQSEHQRKLSVMKNDPSLSGLSPFYDVAPVPAERSGVVDFGSLK